MQKIFGLILLAGFGLVSPDSTGSPPPEVAQFPDFALPFAEPVPLINEYRQPNSDYSAGHRGVDYLLDLGAEILAPADGVIWFAGEVVNRPVLSLKHSGDLISEFEPACTTLGQGSKVSKGQPIGFVCTPDSSYREHCKSCLHFSVRMLDAYLSPIAILGELNPSRLLPIRD